MKDVTAKFARSRKTFQDVRWMKRIRIICGFFSFICELSFDVYLKTQMIEMIADQLREEERRRGRSKTQINDRINLTIDSRS